VIAIPPKSSKSLQPQAIIPPQGDEYAEFFAMKDIRRHRYSAHTAPHIENIDGPTSIGVTKDFQEGDIPFKSGIILTYSFSAYFEAMPKNFSDSQIRDIFVLLWQDNK